MEMTHGEKSEHVGLTLRGILAEDGPEAITLQVGASQFEIQRTDVLHLRDVSEGREGKVVEASIAPDARIIQRVLASASLVGRRPVVAAACDCACNCNCACECACSSSRLFATRPQNTFRAQVAESA
jgi:hypothetical protein